MKLKELFNRLFVEPTTNIWLQLLRYGFVGGVAFVADYGTLFGLTHYAHVHYLWSAGIAFIVGLTVNYLLSISWVFNRNRSAKPWVEFLVFALIGVVGLGLNELIMYVATDIMELHYMISKLISTALVFCWNFFARKLIIFK